MWVNRCAISRKPNLSASKGRILERNSPFSIFHFPSTFRKSESLDLWKTCHHGKEVTVDTWYGNSDVTQISPSLQQHTGYTSLRIRARAFNFRHSVIARSTHLSCTGPCRSPSKCGWEFEWKEVSIYKLSKIDKWLVVGKLSRMNFNSPQSSELRCSPILQTLWRWEWQGRDSEGFFKSFGE